MHKDGPLKNIFKEENWSQVGNASDYMYTRKHNDKYNIERNPDQPQDEPKEEHSGEHKEEHHEHHEHQHEHDSSKIIGELSRLKTEKDQEVSQIVSKINDVIQRQNRLESSLEEIKANLSELGKQFTLYIKKPASLEPSQSESSEKKEALDKPIDRNNVAPKDVAIEKMFNFSNKKF